MTRSTTSADGRRAAGAGRASFATLAAIALTATALAASPDADNNDDSGGGRFTPGPSVRMAPDHPRAPAGVDSPPASAAGGAAEEDIRDIRGPKVVVPTWFIPAIVAALLGCALAGYGLWRWLRRRKRPRPLLPFEVALQQLEALRSLMEPVHAREFSIAVSDIIRRYLEQRFDVTATHRTTEEFLHDLLESTHPSLIRYRPLLSEFLHQCDLVKFGGMSLSVAHMESLQQSGRAFVLETAKPDEPAPTKPAGPPNPATPPAAEAHDSLPSA